MRYAIEWFPTVEVEAYLVKHPEFRDGNEVAAASDHVGATVEFCSTVKAARKLAVAKAGECFFGCAHITREHQVYVECFGPARWERDDSFELEEVVA